MFDSDLLLFTSRLRYFDVNMFALLSELESFEPKCTTEEKFKQLELLSGLLDTENFLIDDFLAKNERKLCQSQESDTDNSAAKTDNNNNQSASLQRKIDIADKVCMAISDELEQLEVKSSDKLRNLSATKSELDLSCQEVSALRISIEAKLQTDDASDRCKRSNNLSKFIEDWSHGCKQKKEKTHLKAASLKRLCVREQQDIAFKSQVIKQVSPAEYVKLQFESKKCRKQLEECRAQISKLRREHAIILSRKITENRKSIDIAKMRRKILDELKSLQATDEKLRIECDQLVETIAHMEKQIEEFRERVDTTEFPRISISDYAKCKEKCEKLASIVKVVERKISLAKNATY